MTDFPETSTDPAKKRGKSTASARRQKLRKTLWPEVSESSLWIRTQRTGFTTIPRAMPLIGHILDQVSGKGLPLLRTYLTLWCWVFDEGLVEIRNPREFAYESGFSGARAEATWRLRMRRLEDLGFIRTKPGLAGDHQYVLLLNPIQRIKEIYDTRPKDMTYHALLGRLAQVGADDMDVL
jgi:hypothetical protein